MAADKKKEKKKHLGRGLDALLGNLSIANPIGQHSAETSVFPPDKQLINGLQEIPVANIKPNPYQPRTSWDEEQISQLAESIKTNGLLQPLVVRKQNDTFQIIAGERRFRASQVCKFETVPAIVRNASDSEMLELALIENIHRTDLNPVEKAKAYKNYIETFNLTQQETAERLNLSRADVANHLRLLSLPLSIHNMLVDGSLSAGHARALLALDDDEMKKKLANKAMTDSLSVRNVEMIVRNHLQKKGKPLRPAKVKSPHIIDLENRLMSALGTQVHIDTKKNPNKGRIVLEFHSLDDFDKIVEKLGLENQDSF